MNGNRNGNPNPVTTDSPYDVAMRGVASWPLTDGPCRRCGTRDSIRGIPLDCYRFLLLSVRIWGPGMGHRRWRHYGCVLSGVSVVVARYCGCCCGCCGCSGWGRREKGIGRLRHRMRHRGRWWLFAHGHWKGKQNYPRYNIWRYLVILKSRFRHRLSNKNEQYPIRIYVLYV